MKAQGFTVWEVTIGVAMVAVLALAAIVNAPSFLGLGKHGKAMNDTAALAGIISQYEMEVGKYPEKLEDLTKAVGQYGPWLGEVPEDPYAGSGSYQYSQDGKKFAVFSVGEDKAAQSGVTGIGGDDIGYVSR